MAGIRFEELKSYLSRVAWISVCFLDGQYDNYTLISDIPERKYDDLYVCGISMIDAEFPRDVYCRPKTGLTEMIGPSEFFTGCGLEVLLTREPLDCIAPRRREDGLLFGDVKKYLQEGRHFSVVMKENWHSEKYEWKKEIPEKYDEMFVYGIGIEANPDKIRNPRYSVPWDSCLTSQMTLVLAKAPRVFAKNASSWERD